MVLASEHGLVQPERPAELLDLGDLRAAGMAVVGRAAGKGDGKELKEPRVDSPGDDL